MFGWRRALAAARRAATASDWTAAEHAYRRVLDARPGNAAAWVQYGHALKEQGQIDAARDAYRSAVALRPDSADAWLQLGHAFKLSMDRDGAIAAYARSAAIDPDPARGTHELIAYGARDQLPEAIRDRREEGAPASPVAAGAGEAIHARARYAAYRRRYVVPAPPRHPGTEWETSTGPAFVMVDARGAIPAAVKVTLGTLLDQADGGWRAVVIADGGLLSHSVASLARVDDRVAFVADDRAIAIPDDAAMVVILRAATMMDRDAIGWLRFAMTRTGCAVAYADHDLSHVGERMAVVHRDPMFQPAPDPFWFADPATAPALLALSAEQARISTSGEGLLSPLDRLRDAAVARRVAHLPILLSNIRTDLVDTAEGGDAFATSAAAPFVPAGDARILVVIQTRDQPAMLADCVHSLVRSADRRDLLDIVIVDNGSREPATVRLLRRWRTAGIARTLPLDGPFNWALANNAAVAAAPAAPLLLFLNNDMRMIGRGWDGEVRRLLAQPAVGAVGAMLRYADRSIQHAGVVMGVGGAGPLHEGVGAAQGDNGPGGRWGRSRLAAAVTGAFIAVRRGDFETVGGFDAAGLPIAFNDIDFCLKIRALGLGVLLSASIQAFHYESKTRGLSLSPAQLAWDHEEFALLRRRWDRALDRDPAYNPHWVREGRPFDGYRYPGLAETVRHIDRSAADDPWAPDGGDADWW